ncbi:hypothetical protein [Serratia inhibens]|uniref:Uncharacterized protein n=1 Tax=Serratia inhibens TaxID=2338073 RepID=A0AA92X0R7_9GAMM|nr:hypothetical protein [Serratia inhibens]ANS44581.1 hypothetical protein Q5A_020795 [Serratia inhibens PRI-2C]RJF53441.1 hypothetical protein D4100_21350 [Serratia inhibens]
MNTAGMLRLWFPSAISISLLNLELPIISLILSAYSLKASGDYAIALSTFMFANAFVFPLCAVVIKMKKSAETLMFSALLAAAVFLIFNLGVWGFRQHISPHIAFITHVFSLSLLAVGVRRYLQGCCILEGKTALMSRASFVRVLVSVLGCYALTRFQVPVDMAAILALVAGAYTEAILLLLLVLRQGIRLHEGGSRHYRQIIAPYFSAFLMTASSLMSNIIVVICLSRVIGGSEVLQYWPLTFGLICISIGAVLDIESILLKILGHRPQKKQQFGFLALLCLAAPILFVALCLILDRFDLLPAGSRTIYMNAEFFIAIVGVSMLWILRGYIRANLMNDNRLRIINASILVAMMTPLAVFYAVEIPNYGVMLSLSIFSALIILELLCYALYGMTQALQRRQIAAE